ALGATVFLEIGASGMLAAPHDEDEALARAAATLWAAGVDVDWTRFHGDAAARRLRLPPLPYARERIWFSPAQAKAPRFIESVRRRIAASARAVPERVALVSGVDRLTYRELAAGGAARRPWARPVADLLAALDEGRLGGDDERDA